MKGRTKPERLSIMLLKSEMQDQPGTEEMRAAATQAMDEDRGNRARDY